MNLRKIFDKQISEQRRRRYPVFFYEDLGRNLYSVQKIDIWKLGSLMETHVLAKEQKFGLPLFVRIAEKDLPK